MDGNERNRNEMNRRVWMIGAASAVAAAALPLGGIAEDLRPQAASNAQQPAQPSADEADRIRRMKWWHEARFGMFIHWGLYSVLGRHEWVMEDEGIPVAEYEPLAKSSSPSRMPRATGRRSRGTAGMKYMVMTTKHHEGFCNFDTKAHQLLRRQARARPRSGAANMLKRRARKACAWASIIR